MRRTRSHLLALVVLVAFGAAAARSDGRLAPGRPVQTTLQVTNTWVFCDEVKYGSYVLGRAYDTLLWVKLPTKYRWLTAMHLAKARSVEFRAVGRKPRGDGYQLEDGEILRVDGRGPEAFGLGLDWNPVTEALFGRDVTDAMRSVRWDRLRGKTMTEVGRITELEEDLRTLRVKFRDHTMTWDAKLRLGRPVARSDVERYRKGAFVAVRGTLSSFTTLNDSVVLSNAEAVVVPDKTGTGWSYLR